MILHFPYRNYPGAPELTERSRKIGNLKQFRQTDKNT